MEELHSGLEYFLLLVNNDLLPQLQFALDAILVEGFHFVEELVGGLDENLPQCNIQHLRSLLPPLRALNESHVGMLDYFEKGNSCLSLAYLVHLLNHTGDCDEKLDDFLFALEELSEVVIRRLQAVDFGNEVRTQFQLFQVHRN